MASITIRYLSEATYRALKASATTHGRNLEEEVRHILDDAVAHRVDIGLGSRVAQIAAEAGGLDLALERTRTASPPISFG